MAKRLCDTVYAGGIVGVSMICRVILEEHGILVEWKRGQRRIHGIVRSRLGSSG